MLRKLVGVVVVLCVAGLVSAQKEKDKDKGGKGAPRTKATIVKVEAGKNLLVVKMDGKEHELKVGKDVKFIGPRGGVSDDGIKDKRLTPGVELGLVMDGKNVKEVHIPVIRKTKEKAKADKDKSK